MAVVHTIGWSRWSNLESDCYKIDLEEGGAVIEFWAWEQVWKSYLQGDLPASSTLDGYIVWLGWRIECFLTWFLFFSMSKNTQHYLLSWDIKPTKRTYFSTCNISEESEEKTEPAEFSWCTALRDCGLEENTGTPKANCSWLHGIEPNVKCYFFSLPLFFFS